MNHIDDLAEFYALGDLSAAEKLAVEQHVVTCQACLRKLGEAEEMLLTLEQQYAATAPPRFLELGLNLDRRAPSRWWWVVAAAFALGLLPSMFAWLGRGPSDTNLAAIAMLHSHFNHSQFTGAGDAPSAKVLYPRDRSWIFVMVEGDKRYDVYAVNGSTATKLGAISPQGATSNFFAQHPGALDGVELRDGTTVVERAQVR